MADRALVEKIADSIRQRRYELRLTQKDVAEIAGCHWTFVSDVEREKPTVRLDKLLDLLQAVGFNLQLVQDSDER